MLSGAHKSSRQMCLSFLGMIFGAFLAAFSLEVFLLPNHIIDGGVIGFSIIVSELLGSDLWLYPLVFIFNLPFLFLAYRFISKALLLQMFVAILSFSFFGHFITLSPCATTPGVAFSIPFFIFTFLEYSFFYVKSI